MQGAGGCKGLAGALCVGVQGELVGRVGLVGRVEAGGVAAMIGDHQHTSMRCGTHLVQGMANMMSRL